VQFTPLPIAQEHLWKHLLEGNCIGAEWREGNSILEMQEDLQAWKLGCREVAFSHRLLKSLGSTNFPLYFLPLSPKH